MNNNRMSWLDTLMHVAYAMTMRSPDPHTRHGCVFVDSDNHFLGIGYNGSPTGCQDEELPWDRRPDKYFYAIHAEENAIMNSAPRILKGSTAYITGFPCHKCIRGMLQMGVARIVYGQKQSLCQDRADQEAAKKMLSFYPQVKVEAYEGDIVTVAVRFLEEMFVTMTGGDKQGFARFLHTLAEQIAGQAE